MKLIYGKFRDVNTGWKAIRTDSTVQKTGWTIITRHEVSTGLKKYLIVAVRRRVFLDWQS